MRIAVFGSTGRTGRTLLRDGIWIGHEMTAFARDPEGVRGIDGLARTVVGDGRNVDDVLEAVAGQDAVITVLARTGGDDARVVTHCHEAIATAMKRTGTQRLVMTSVYGPFATRPRVLAPLVRRAFATHFDDSLAAERLLRATDLDWTVLRPARLTDRRPRQTRMSERPFSRGPFSLSRDSLSGALLKVAARRDLIGRSLNLTG